MADGPSIHRRQLGRWLQSLREEQGKTQGQVAKQRHWDTSKVSRIETGRVKVHPSDLLVLLDIYAVTDDKVRHQMLELAEHARSETGGFVAANAVRLRPGGFLNFERDATAITVWEPNIVPGLLQTREYATALFKVGMPKASTKERAARVELRLDRQRRLYDTHPPLLTAVVDESVLRRQIGGPETYARQLDALKTWAAVDNVALRVMPFAVPDNPLPHGPATLLEFASAPDLNLVYLEGVAGDYYATKEKEFPYYRKLVDSIVERSLTPKASLDLLNKIVSSYTAPQRKS